MIRTTLLPLVGKELTLSVAAGTLSSADNLYKQFGSRSGSTELRSRSGSNPSDTLIVFLKECFEKVNFEKKVSR